MLKAWRLGRLLGFPITLNPSFLLLLAIVFVAFGGTTGVLVISLAFAFVLLHELGHAVVARALGVRTSEIELGFLGGAAKMELTRNPRHELLIAAAGPGVSLVLGGLGLGLGLLVGSPLVMLAGWINFVIAAFNLIPALPMDGGRILRAALVPKLGYIRATDISVTIARVVAIGFAVLAVTGIASLQLLVLAPFLWLMGNRERALARVVDDPFRSRRAW